MYSHCVRTHIHTGSQSTDRAGPSVAVEETKVLRGKVRDTVRMRTGCLLSPLGIPHSIPTAVLTHVPLKGVELWIIYDLGVNEQVRNLDLGLWL